MAIKSVYVREPDLWLWERLAALARERGTSVPRLLREAIEDLLRKHERAARPRSPLGGICYTDHRTGESDHMFAHVKTSRCLDEFPDVEEAK